MLNMKQPGVAAAASAIGIGAEAKEDTALVHTVEITGNHKSASPVRPDEVKAALMVSFIVDHLRDSSAPRKKERPKDSFAFVTQAGVPFRGTMYAALNGFSDAGFRDVTVIRTLELQIFNMLAYDYMRIVIKYNEILEKSTKKIKMLSISDALLHRDDIDEILIAENNFSEHIGNVRDKWTSRSFGDTSKLRDPGKLKILDWKDFTNHPKFPEAINKVNSAYLNDSDFAQKVEETVKKRFEMVCKGFKNVEQFDPTHFMARCLRLYVFQECEVMCLQPLKEEKNFGYEVILYPDSKRPPERKHDDPYLEPPFQHFFEHYLDNQLQHLGYILQDPDEPVERQIEVVNHAGVSQLNQKLVMRPQSSPSATLDASAHVGISARASFFHNTVERTKAAYELQILMMKILNALAKVKFKLPSIGTEPLDLFVSHMRDIINSYELSQQNDDSTVANCHT